MFPIVIFNQCVPPTEFFSIGLLFGSFYSLLVCFLDHFLSEYIFVKKKSSLLSMSLVIITTIAAKNIT